MLDFRFAYPHIFWIFIPILIFLCVWRWKYYRAPLYLFSLVDVFKKQNIAKKSRRSLVYGVLRAIILFGLIFIIARPQWVDKRSNINVDGIDIVITLDVSGSMRIFDDLKDKRTRIEVAKTEALHFIEKREFDPIGIVIFAVDALSRCPLTLDKNVLQEIVNEIHLGIIDDRGTSLGTGLATAVNRLRNSKSKSKVIILLTDGQPQGNDKISPEEAMHLAKKFDIKVYTIGVGNKKGGYFPGHFGYIEQIPDSIDEVLLKKIARGTGGKFFRANNANEMRKIYDAIDSLEKTEYNTDVFHRYYEAFFGVIWLLLLFLFFELFLHLWLWRGL
jgi:Ca-activated chloride channel homolog